MKQKPRKQNKHTQTHALARVHVQVQDFYFRDRQRKKKEENRNYFVVKDVIVNVYKVKTDKAKSHKIMCKTKKCK